MKRRTANLYLAGYLLGMFGAMSDDEQTIARERVNSNDEAGVKELIGSVLKPEFDRLDDSSQQAIKASLSYFLTVGAPWERLYESSMPPIDPPDDPRLFFIWLWDVLAPDESYVMAAPHEVDVHHDIGATSALRLRK